MCFAYRADYKTVTDPYRCGLCGQFELPEPSPSAPAKKLKVVEKPKYKSPSKLSKGKFDKARKKRTTEPEGELSEDSPPEAEADSPEDPPMPKDADAARILGKCTPHERRCLFREAKSIHHLMTHLPKNPYCQACNRAKMYAERATKSSAPMADKPKKFGDQVTCDHVISKSAEAMGTDRKKYAMIIRDIYTNWIEFAPQMNRDKHEARAALRRFDPKGAIKSLWTDNARELMGAAADLGYNNPTSTPYRHQSNTQAERYNRLVLEGTRAIISASGFAVLLVAICWKVLVLGSQYQLPGGRQPLQQTLQAWTLQG